MAKSNQADWEEEQGLKNYRAQHLLDVREIDRVNIDNRAETRRLMRRVQAERRETEMEEKLLRLKESQRFQAEKKEQENRLAQEAQRIQHEELLERKMRQKLRESSVELKELAAKLKAAYALKELDAQLHEKRLTAIQEKNLEQRTNELVRGSWLRQREEERRLEHQKLVRKKQYRDQLQGQMIDEMNKKQLLFEEFLREKRLLDEVVRKMYEEDLQAEIERMEKVQRTKQQIEAFKMAQAVWREKENRERAEENKRLIAFLETQGHRQEANLEEKRLRNEAKAMLSEKVAREIYQVERKKKECEEVLQELAEEERQAEAERKCREEIEKKLRMRGEMREAHHQQTAERRARLEEEAAKEHALHQQLLDKREEDARIDQLTRNAQRSKRLQFRQEADEIMEQKRIQRAEEMQQLARLDELMEEQEKSRLKRVEAERLSMLREHATVLLGYLPAGVLRETDLPLLGPEFVDMYGSRKT